MIGPGLGSDGTGGVCLCLWLQICVLPDVPKESLTYLREETKVSYTFITETLDKDYFKCNPD